MKNLVEQKLALMRDILHVTQQQLLLVNLEALTPLLEQKESLIERIREVDGKLERYGGSGDQTGQIPSWRDDMNRLVAAILDNEQTMEARIEEAQMELKRDLQILERQGRVKQYLEGTRTPGRSVNLKR